MYDLAIIGSGYGGSVIAARLAPAGRTLLIERGRWWRPGEFPSSIAGLARSYMSERNPQGLWGMRLGDGTGNAFASAFGGASAINYGITARPDDHVFDDWPISTSELAPHYERALEVLAPEPNPIGDQLGDKQFLDLVEPGRRVDLENTIDWKACTQCGRCVPGCNSGAKRGLDRTYLAMAIERGIELRLETEVRALIPSRDVGYELELLHQGTAVERVTARRVVIAAGTIGTLELLHRCRDWLPLGPRFGTDLSMNGDGLAFLYNTPHQLSSHHGAPISTSVRIPFDDDGKTRTLTVMSGRVPRAALRFAGGALAVLAGPLGRPTSGRRFEARTSRALRRLIDLAAVGPRGALAHSFMYKLDAQDSNRGQARFTAKGHAVIDWPDYAADPIMQFAAARLNRWARKVGGRVVPNLATLPGMRSFSVHPLGGCRMGRSIQEGVVDEVGRVFDPRGGTYPGLRIVDASIVPTSIGVPPSLTVAALAERAAASLSAEG